MTGPTTQSKTGGEQFEAHVYDELGAPPPDADLEVEAPDDDSRLLRLSEEFFLLAEDDKVELF